MKEQHNNKTWYIIGGVVIVLLIILLISMNSNNNRGPVCNSPYILNGASCCLDSNYNSICDNDEPQQNTPTNNYREYQVNAYITHDFIQGLSNLPSYPAREYTNYPVWDGGDARYYTAGNLVLYTDYDAEAVTCAVKEYYGSVLNDQFTVNIVVGYYVTGIGYEKSNLPTQVRYDYDCTAQQSGKKYSNSYRVYPVANN